MGVSDEEDVTNNQCTAPLWKYVALDNNGYLVLHNTPFTQSVTKLKWARSAQGCGIHEQRPHELVDYAKLDAFIHLELLPWCGRYLQIALQQHCQQCTTLSSINLLCTKYRMSNNDNADAATVHRDCISRRCHQERYKQ